MLRKCLKNMVPPTRIERAARGLGNHCSIQLSYGGMLEKSHSYVTRVNRHGGVVPMNVPMNFERGVLEVGRRDDVIAIKNRTGSMSRNLHGHSFRNT